MEYEIKERLGEGGFGIVDKVHDEDGNQLAMKTFKDPNIPDIDADVLRKRFKREVEYQGQFDHPNIVKVIDQNLIEDTPFFVMELADSSLLDEIKVDRTLRGDPSQALFDILAGLEAIHALGIAHRDLKPANVLKLINQDGTSRYAISDFGLMTAAESESTTLTQSNIGMGTVRYAPPECVSNFKRATAQSDIYSFGAILHDIFSGVQRIPYSELTAPGAVGSVIERATKTLPLRRYQNIADLRIVLYDALDKTILTASSDEEEEVHDLLDQDEPLTDDEWDKIFITIENYEDRNTYLGNIFRLVTIEHITFLHANAPELLTALGRSYCAFVQDGGFDFNYCDVLATKVDHFFKCGGIELKALAIIALLKMGTSHNRWFVERKFMSHANIDLIDEVAERVRIEVEVQDVDFKRLFAHVRKSISASRANLHPILRDLL